MTSLTEVEAKAILATLPHDPNAKAHRRTILRELAWTHCPGCSTKMPKTRARSNVRRTSCGPFCPGDVDEVVVLRLLAGTPVISNKAERLEAVNILTARGMSGSEIAEHLHTTKRSVIRYRASNRGEAA